MPDPWRPRRILVAYPRHPDLVALLRARRPDLEIRGRTTETTTPEDLGWAEVLLGFSRPAVTGWGGIRWIHSIGAGMDAFLFRTDLPDHILLTRTAEDFGPQIGEYCLARALAAAQHLAFFQREQAARRWTRRDSQLLAGTRAVVAGTGLVGRGIARAFGAAGVIVDGLSRSGAAVAPFRRVRPASEFDHLVPGARWLVLALPLTQETWHFLDRTRLAQCAGLYLINVGRGGLVEEAVLPEALDRGWLAGAALDVFETEPLPPESPLWVREEVTISPHISGVTSIEDAVAGFLECLDALERGERPGWTVDPARGY